MLFELIPNLQTLAHTEHLFCMHMCVAYNVLVPVLFVFIRRVCLVCVCFDAQALRWRKDSGATSQLCVVYVAIYEVVVHTM